MAERQRVCDQHNDQVTEQPRRVAELDLGDLEYVVNQLALAVERASHGERLGTHLIKRLRRSKGILLTAREECLSKPVVALDELRQKRKSLLAQLFCWR